MQWFEIGLQFPLNSHKMLKSFINSPTLRNKTLSSIPYVFLKKASVEKGVDNGMIIPSQKVLSHKLSQREPQNEDALYEESLFQVKHSISLIEDPLWKRVCTEIVNVIGPPSVLEICSSRLGSTSPQDKIVDLYCQTKEIAQLAEKCACVILGNLQQYFPTLKEIRIKTEVLARKY